MFDGLDIRKQSDEEHARYWGDGLTLDGFFVNRLMSRWQDDVGADAESPNWQLARSFQAIYAKHGVADNFVKVAIWSPHDWDDAGATSDVVQHFAHVAGLVRFAGFKGVALDLEPYVSIWARTPGSDRDDKVYRAGMDIGRAMTSEAPDMSLILLQDALLWAQRGQGYNGGYALAEPFLRGLLGAPFRHVVVAIEGTYAPGSDALAHVAEARQRWHQFVRANHLPIGQVSIAPGLWPLGKSYQDKSARMNPVQWAELLRKADDVAGDYVWIYGFGSAWQDGGPYGKGPVAPDFARYVEVLRARAAHCGAR